MKERILKNKKSVVSHVIALGILLVGFILGRYVFFDVHGMKEFPLVLLSLGLIVMIVSLLTAGKLLPYLISVGYIIGFVFGFIFQVTKKDANGVSVNNLWVIWAAVYLVFIVIGVICEWCLRKYVLSDKWKKGRGTKIIITIFGVVILWLCVGITDFALVHNYRKPLFCVGVDLADDGGSGRYVGVGYSFDIEGNFMPEGKNPGVTSYSGYLFGKEVCRGFWEEMLAAPYKSMGDVSLNPVFGDSYTDVKVGDEVVVYFDGNIAESDPLQLGTVYAITLRTPVNRIDAEASNVDKLIYGDMSVTDELGMTEGDIVIAKPMKVTEPPELIVVCGGEEFKTLKGMYSWEYENEDGTSTAIMADCAHPLECADIMPEVRIVYSTSSAIHPRMAYLQFDIVPDEVEVRYWEEEAWGDTMAVSKGLEVQVTEADFADGGYSTKYSVELLDGNYIYEVVAKWTSAEAYKGEAQYSFRGVLGEYEPVLVEE